MSDTGGIMPLVEENITVKALPEVIYPIIKDVKKFPEFMANVNEVIIREEGDGWQISEWHNEVDGRKISWVEKDEYEPENYLIKFTLVEGDLKKYYGHWRLHKLEADATNIEFSIYFEFGIPMLAPLLHPLLARKLRENMRQMLTSLKQKLEQ